jgi:hypothetical protein
VARTTIAIAFRRTIERRRRSIIGQRPLALDADRGDLRAVEAGGRSAVGVLRVLDDLPEQVSRSGWPGVGDDGVERLKPFTRLAPHRCRLQRVSR